VIRISVVALCLVATSAAAQTTGRDSTNPFAAADPARSRPVEYRSVFSPEPPAADADLTWQRANEEMGRLRGHAGQLKDDTSPKPAETGPASAPTAPAPGHSNH
jgi:hypothetical protein